MFISIRFHNTHKYTYRPTDNFYRTEVTPYLLTAVLNYAYFSYINYFILDFVKISLVPVQSHFYAIAFIVTLNGGHSALISF